MPPGSAPRFGNRGGDEDERHLEDDGSPEPRGRSAERSASRPPRHSGNGYISQPSTSAAAMNPPNIIAPVRSCARGSSRSSTAKDERHEKRKQHEQQEVAGHLRPMRDVERVEDDEEVQQAGDDQEAVAVLVGHGGDRAAAGVEHPREHPGRARAADSRPRRGRPAARTGRTEKSRPCSSRPIGNIAGSASRKTMPFCRRPIQRWPAPGTSHAARHSSTSMPGSAAARGRSAAVDFVAISFMHHNASRSCHWWRDGGRLAS